MVYDTRAEYRSNFHRAPEPVEGNAVFAYDTDTGKISMTISPPGTDYVRCTPGVLRYLVGLANEK